MSRLIHRPQAPLRSPVASSEPKIIREVISERVELRGKPGDDGDPGKDGKDGTNAFPTGSQHVTAFYVPSRSLGRTGFMFEAVYGEGDKFLDIRKNSLILAPGHYRIIIAGELGTFSPIGMVVKVVKSDDPVNIGNMLPDVIELPRQIAPAISVLKVGVTVEYVDNDAAG